MVIDNDSMDRWEFAWSAADNDQFVDPPLSDEQRRLLSTGVWIWGGPTRLTEDVARVLGWPDRSALLAHSKDLALRLRDGQALRKSEWATALTSLELAWASSYYGAGGEWDIVTDWSDEETHATLRSIQRVLIGLRAPRASTIVP